MMKPINEWDELFMFSISDDIDKFIEKGHLTEVLKDFLTENVKFESDDMIIPAVITLSNSIRKEAITRLKSLKSSKKKHKDKPIENKKEKDNKKDLSNETHLVDNQEINNIEETIDSNVDETSITVDSIEENEPIEYFEDTHFICPSCGEYAVIKLDDSNSLICEKCNRVVSIKYVQSDEGFICPNCMELMEQNEGTTVICPQCEFICDISDFNNKIQDITPPKQEIKGIELKPIDKIYDFEELPLPLNDPEDKSITMDTMKLRMEQLRINGFFWNGEVFVSDEGKIFANIEILSYTTFHFETILKCLKEERRQQRLSSDLYKSELPWK